MKKTKQHFVIGFLTVLLLNACGGIAQPEAKGKTDTASEPVAAANDFVDVDISTSKLKWPLIAKATKGYTLDESISDELTISAENATYRISEWPYGASVEQVAGFKNEIENATAYKFEKYILEKPDAFIAKTSMGYIVMRIVKVGEKYYDCDVIPLFASETEEAAQKIYEMIGMLKAK
jgi:hypothetical protein